MLSLGQTASSLAATHVRHPANSCKVDRTSDVADPLWNSPAQAGILVGDLQAAVAHDEWRP